MFQGQKREMVRQCCKSGSGSESGSDPDSKGSLEPYPYADSQSGSGSKRAKITHKKKRRLINFPFEVLDVVFLGLKASPVTWTFFMKA
jgi:hypothetical protein